MKKIMILLLAVVLLLPLCGCTNGKKPEDTEKPVATGAVTTENVRDTLKHNLPDDLDFDNIVLKLAVRDRDDIAFEIDPDANSVDIMARNIAERNRETEDTLTLSLEIRRIPGTWGQRNDFITNVQNDAAGGSEYDIVMAANYMQVPLMIAGIYKNLYTTKYMDLDQPWWNGDFNAECAYGGKLYMTEGELTLSMLDSAFVMFFDTLNFANVSESGESLYDLVRQNLWTFEKMEEYAREYYIDDGDTVRNSQDTFGMVTPAFSCGRDGFPLAFNVRVTETGADGRIKLCFQSDRNIGIYEKFYQFVHNNEGVYENGNNDGAREECRNMFQNGQALFITELLNYASILRGLSREYGIIPLPMFDSAQAKECGYQTASEAVHSQISLTAGGAHIDAADAALELLCYLTYKNVTLDYYDTVKYRNQKQPEAVEMLDIILESITTTFGAQFSEQMGSPFPVMGSKENVATDLESQVDPMQTKMDILKRKILALK